jgi:hypothetical protein
VTGCRDDSDCAAGQICDQMLCRAGCRGDSGCAAGQICDATTLACRGGCRATAGCPLEQVCNVTAATCVAGCDGDARCRPGRICQSGQCVDGCRTDATCPSGQRCFSQMCRSYCTVDGDCPLGQVCSTSQQQCVDGCGLPGKVMSGTEYLRCPLGETCQASGCSSATHACQTYACSFDCLGPDPLNPAKLATFTCHDNPQHPMICWGPGYSACSETCSLTDRSHTCLGAGQVCRLFYDTDNGGAVQTLCGPACQSDVECESQLDPSLVSVDCTCQLTDLPDAPAGSCRYPSATSGAEVCVLPLMSL